KIAAYGGLFLGSPVILWELWRFITPGLHSNEKRYAVPFVTASVVLFGGGIVIAYVIFPHALQWLGSVGGPSLHEIYNPNQYLSLMVALMLVFGLTFEFPVVLVSLELAGVLRPQKLASWRRWAFVLIVLFAAIIVPTGDPFSMLALAVPMYAFYEGSILIGKLLRRQ
ncbi:MAG TPA: twin-arginine translocase subunit TatC, partial [Acidimicrobiales bacterium]|nr:twin-arginine translocase subunit TatC [Acidimicrobiales bacterium]